MNEQNKKNEGGLFDKDPFPKDVWEIAYKNTGGKPFEKGNAFTALDEKAKGAAQSSASKLTPEQQRLKSELKVKQERKASATYINSTATGTYTAYSYTQTTPAPSSKSTVEPPISYINDKDDAEKKDESLLEMLSDISSVEDFGKIAKKLKESDVFKKSGFWVAAAILVFYIMNVLSALFE